MQVTTRPAESTAAPARLLMAIELGRNEWKLGFSVGVGQRPRRRTLAATAWRRLPEEIAAAKQRFGLSPDATVVSCYEAGPDAFWVHRYLTTIDVENVVVDSASIEVNRRARRAKTDRLDVEKLLALLIRYVGGERTAWRVVRVPGEADEQRRQVHRELLSLKRDRTRVTNRIRGLLATQGVRMAVRADFREQLVQVRRWDGEPLPPALSTRLGREWEKAELLTRQITELERVRQQVLAEANDPALELVRRLLALRGIGPAAAWVFVMELFAWRELKNRRQVGAIAGLVATPYRSGTINHEQGISKAGNATVRAIAVQIAWAWLRYQPQSALTQWYTERFARGGPRARKIGIVAVARRLLIDLWRYLDAGVIPAGAVFNSTAP